MAPEKFKEYGDEVSTGSNKCANANCHADIKANLRCCGIILLAVLTVVLAIASADIKAYSQEFPWEKRTTSSWGLIRYVHTNVNIRSSRSAKSNIVGQLTTGQKTKAAFLKGGWFAVFKVDEAIGDEKNAIGYVYAPLLKRKPPSSTE